jgi:peptidyl-prolyl cis-trans isomerase D
MAVIGKIREKSALVMIIIGVGMLAFILGDLFKSGNQFFSDGNNVGEIDGVEISGIDFNNRVEQAVASWESQNQGNAANAEVRTSLRDQAWNELIMERVLGTQYAELGISVSSEELFDMVQGSNPHPQVQQAFTDPQTGVFNPTQVLQFLKSLETMPAENRNQWLLFEDGIQKERVAAKYNNLLVKGMYATKSQLKNTYKEQNEQRSLKFVAKRYNTVNDSTIEISDADLKAYYNEHKNEYKQDQSRDIEYVKFEVTPSDLDKKDALDWITEAKEDFKKSDNDSSFVEFNSDIAQDPTNMNFYGSNEMPFGLDSTFFYQEIGTVSGPTEENGTFVLTKISATKMYPDSVKARHILLKYTQTATDTLLEGKLDSIKTIIENGGDFAAIATEKSEDVGSAIEGGDLGWFKAGQMVPEFNDACFDGKAGDIVIVQTQFGFHLIEVQEQSEKVKKIQLAKVVRKIEASNETFDAVFAKASSFYSSNNTLEAFEKATETDEFTKFIAAEIKVADKNVDGLSDVREMIRWSFNNEKGTISAPFQFGNTFVVACLSEVREEGIATMDQVAIQVEIGAKKKKKAAQFIEEMKGAANLEAVAQKIGSAVESAANVNFAGYAIPGLGQEPRISGQAVTLQKGQMSIPIEGQTGVFVIMVENVIPAPETTDYSAIKSQMNQEFISISSSALEALKDKFGVVDKRYKFY